MGLIGNIRRIFRQSTDVECIERARKVVRLRKNWGKSIGVFYCLLGVVTMAISIGFGYVVWLITQLAVQLPNQAAPQPRDLTWLGFAVGLVLGFLAGFMLFKGAHLLGQGIIFIRGDRISELLISYYDGIRDIMEKEREVSDESRE
jgi:hypothetical protein